MTIVSEFSYTLESIIQAGKKKMAIAHVAVASNARTRPSRLFDNVFSYIKQSSATIVRIYSMYEPLKVFTYLGSTVFLIGLAISARFLYFYFFTNLSAGKVQSLILAAVLMIVGFQIVLIGLVADVISGTRKLLEDLLYRVRSMELGERTRAEREDRGALTWPSQAPSRSSFPACNESAAIGGVVRELLRGRTLARSPRDRRRLDRRHGRAGHGGRRAGHPPSVQQGQRRGREERHSRRHGRLRARPRRRRPAPARRCAAPRREARRVRPRRRRAVRRNAGRIDAAPRQSRAQPARELSDRAADSGSHLRVPRRASRLPAGIPAPAAQRLLDADDDDAGVRQGGLQRGVRAGRTRARASARRRSGSRATGRSSCSSCSA